MEQYFSTYKKSQTQERSSKRHNKQQQGQFEVKRMFKFSPDIQLLKQITSFNTLLKNKLWNGNIQFRNFLGGFKIEYWIYIEKSLRNCENIKKLKFTKSKLTSEHLMLLMKLLVWLQPTSIELEFNNNELDDATLNEFIDELIYSQINLKYLLVSNNPGIFRGQFLKNLSKKLEKQFSINLRINEQFKSIILYTRKLMDEKCFSYIQKKLKAMIYHSFNLSNCFTEQNYQGFESLIQQCYNDSTLETIYELNISNNYLGPNSLVESLFFNLSKAKGLLKLGLNNLNCLNDQICKALIGNRYSYLRLQELDLSNNSSLDESALQILLTEIVSKSCKQFHFKNTFQQESALLAKLYHFGQAFRNRIKQNQMLNLEKVDFSTLAHFQQYDLLEDLLKFIVFNQFSSVEELVLNKLNDKVCFAHIKAIEQYINFRNNKKILSLKTLILKQQNNIISDESIRPLLNLLFFTVEEQLIQIETIKFRKKCFELDQNCFNFQQCIQSLDQFKKFTLKHIYFRNTFATDQLLKKIIQVFLLGNNFQLSTFSLKENDFNDSISLDKYLLQSQYIEKQIDIKVHSLTKLTISVLGLQINISLFLKCFILNNQIKLKYLNLSNVILHYDQLLHENYVDQQPGEIISLEVIKFINNTDKVGKASQIFSEYCLFNQDQDVEIIHISEFMFQIPNNLCFPNLKKICFCEKFQNFDLMLKIILNSEKLEEIVFKRLEINKDLVDRFQQSFLQRRQNEGQSPKIFYFVKSVSFIECVFTSELIHLFFIDYHFELENLKIVQCKGFENQLATLNEKLLKFGQFINTQLKRLYIQNCKLSKNFQHFIKFLGLSCFNAELIEEKDLLCQIEEFTLQNCQLNDDFMIGLNELIQMVIEQELVSKRFLKFINFSENNQISAQQWKKFYSLVFNNMQIKQKRKNTILNYDFSFQESQIQDIIQQNHLFLQNKVIKDPDQFVQKPPQRLQNVQLKFITDFQSQKEQKDYYQSMIQGLIFFKENKITNLKLGNFDLEYFVKITQELIEQYPKDQKRKLNNIKKLSLIQVSSVDLQFSLNFYNIFMMNLQILKLSDIQSGIIEGLLTFLQKFDGKLLISTFYLTRIDEYLNVTLSNQFLQDIIFGKKMPIKNFKLDNALSFKADPDFVKQNLNQYLPKIEKFTFKIQNQESFQFVKTFSRFLLESQNLKEFIVESQQDGSLIFENVDSMNSLPKLNFLKLKSKVQLSPKLLEYIAQNSSTIQKVSLKNIILSNIDLTEKWFQQSEQIFMNCCLSTKIDKMNEQDQKFLIDKLIIGNYFLWSKIKLKSSEGLQFFKFGQNYQNLKILEINAHFEMDSKKKISGEFLSEISQHLIFNENSKLNELKLISCNITVTQIFKLISYAENFKLETLQELSLKRFCLSNSFNIDDDAFKELCENLIFFQHIRLVVLELVHLNLTNQMINQLVESGRKWIANQKQKPFFSFKCLNFAFNDTIGATETWDNLCKTFLFTDNTPNLMHLFLNGMDIKNHIAKLIANNAFQYFKSKPLTFKHSLKEVNFSQNKSLNELGWYFLSKYFFFQRNVELIDIDVTECELNDESKIQQFMLPIFERSKTQGKLGIYRFRSDNIKLKNLIYGINQIPRKLEFKIYKDLPFKRIKYPGWGSIEGKNLQFGTLQQNIMIALNQQRKVNFNECWKSVQETKFGMYHLKFIESFLQILPKIVSDNQYSFSYYGLDQLFNFFNYPQSGYGSPYPLAALFNPKCQDFFSQSNVNKITIIETFFANLEKPKQTEIWRIYHHIIQKKNNLDLIEIEYTLDDDLIEFLLENSYSEKDIIKFIRLIPPSQIIIQNSLSLQAIKGIYSIMFENNYYQYSHISYDQGRFYNNGIGYSLRAMVYGINVQNRILIFFKKIIYFFLSIFVSDATKYTFSSEIKTVNQKLQNSLLYFDFLVLLTLCYLFMCIGVPIILTIQDIDNQDYLCKNGINQIATYSYYGFAFISLIFETLLYKQIVKLIPSHMQKLIDDEQQLFNQYEKEVQKQSLFNLLKSNQILPQDEHSHLKEAEIEGDQSLLKKINTNIKIIANSEFAQFVQISLSIIISQITKYDLYNDIVFIINCFNCKQSDLFQAALVITAFNLVIYMIYFIEILIRRIQRIKIKIKYLSTQTINDFFDLCSVGRNVAIAQILDNIAPFNVSVFPNHKLIRTMVPAIAGKSINKSIRNYLIKFLFEDVPQLTLQFIFLYRLTVSSQIILGWSIYITLSISIVAIILSFFKFMKIRPSTISQTDFDKLERNSSQIYEFKQQHFQKELIILQKFEAYLRSENEQENQGDKNSELML